MATSDPDQPSERSVPDEEPVPAVDMTPTSEVEVHVPSDVTAETSAIARVEVATSPAAFAAPAIVLEGQETSVQMETVSLTTTVTQTTLHMGSEDVVLLLQPGGGRLVAE